MRGRQRRGTGRWAGFGSVTVIAALVLALGAPAGPSAGEGSAAAARKHSVKLLTKSQRTMLRRNRVRVRLVTQRAMTVRFTGIARRTGVNPVAVRAVTRRKVRMRRAGR